MKLSVPSTEKRLSPHLFPKVLGLISVVFLATIAIPSNAAPQASMSHPTIKRNSSSSKKQPKSPRSSQFLRTLENLFVPPKQDAPKSTVNSATRNHKKCPNDEAEVQAFVPPQGYGLSSSDRPAISLAVQSTSAQQVALIFRSESGDLDYRAWLPIPQQSKQESLDPTGPELTQFKLPSSSSALLPNQPYRWSLILVCGETIEPDDPTFMGWVEYREPSAEEQDILAELSIEEKRRWYGRRGYWYDMVQP